MSYFDISGAVFNNQLRELETSDPAHADIIAFFLVPFFNCTNTFLFL